MPLNPPEIGPVSVCSTTFVVSQQLPGATITLYVDQNPLPPYTASQVWEEFNLPPGLQLGQGDIIQATQSLNGETSRSSIMVPVQGKGSAPSLPRSGSQIYACAGHVLLLGMTPGTVAEVWHAGSKLGGQIASNGGAIVSLSQQIPYDTQLEARAVLCGFPPASIMLPVSETPPFQHTGRVPAPRFGSPAMECIEWLRIEGVFPGATVVLERGDGSWQSWGAVAPSWLVHLNQPLQHGEEITIRQEFGDCGATPDRYRERVRPLHLDKPVLDRGWCQGRVTAFNLQPGATVVFFDENGLELGKSGAPDTWAAFTLYQPHSEKIGARQELCGVKSDPSNLIDSRIEADAPQPQIVGPVHECQTSVLVKGQSAPGGEIEVWSNLRGRIGYWSGFATERRISVPSLVEGENIQAKTFSCDGRTALSPFEPVLSYGDLLPFVIDAPIYTGDQVVRVRDVIADIELEAYVDGRWAAAMSVKQDPAEITLPKALAYNEKVKVVAHFCGQSREDEVTVENRPVAPPPPPAPATTGYSKVRVFNCHTGRNPLEVWALDHTTGTSTHVGTLPQQYDEWGNCPGESEPLDVELTDGHTYEIVMVDVYGPLCGVNDPMTLGCRRDVIPVAGYSSGSVLPVIVA